MKEIEVWSEIKYETFVSKSKEFKDMFGNPTHKKRLALRFGFNNDFDTNTRIRITDGYPEIVQKTKFNNSIARDEVSYKLEKDPDEIIKVVNFFRNILINSKDTHFYLIQFENYIWDTKEFELKLTHQIGKEDVYSFEIELKDGKKDENDLKKLCTDLKLSVQKVVKNDEFWIKYNNRVNIDVRRWSDEKLKSIIEKYL
jgi:hypothetical protein